MKKKKKSASEKALGSFGLSFLQIVAGVESKKILSGNTLFFFSFDKQNKDGALFRFVA